MSKKKKSQRMGQHEREENKKKEESLGVSEKEESTSDEVSSEGTDKVADDKETDEVVGKEESLGVSNDLSLKKEDSDLEVSEKEEEVPIEPHHRLRLSKILTVFLVIAILVLGVFIVLIGGLFIKQVCKDKKDAVYNYESSIEDAISLGNASYFEYFLDHKKDENLIISPLAVQKGLYEYNLSNGTEDSNIFKAFGNGYQSWGSSSELLDSEYLETILLGVGKDIDNTVISAEDVSTEVGKRIENFTDTYISDIDLSDYMKECKMINVLGLDVKLSDGWYNQDTKLVYYSGSLEVSSGTGVSSVEVSEEDGQGGILDVASDEDYLCVRIPMKDDYKLYLIKNADGISNISDVLVNLKPARGTISLNPYVYQSKGMDADIVFDTSLYNSLKKNTDYAGIVSVFKFGINCKDLKRSDKTEEYYDFTYYDEFLEDYSFIVVNDKGQFVLLGYVK